MKNIHLIPTDKPSRLHLWTDENGRRLELCELEYSHTRNTQHIYITSSEEIKEGDWVFNKISKEVYTILELWEVISYEKKIILTTDQDLINEGVQSIPDDFIEWYVENPKCEEVEIESWQTKGEWDLSYKIIIPKKQIISSEEDAKIFVDAINNAPEPNDKLKKAFKNFKYVGECKGNQNGCFLDSCGHDCGCFTRVVKEEPKQETLEEAAVKKFNDFKEKNPIVLDSHVYPYKLGFLHGTKWQQERMYSEEEVVKLWNWLNDGFMMRKSLPTREELIGWFEQFKKTK